MDEIKNEIDRQVDNNEPIAAVVSDLTYVRVGNRWNYICILIDLLNRDIIGYSAWERKVAHLVHKALQVIKAILVTSNYFTPIEATSSRIN